MKITRIDSDKIKLEIKQYLVRFLGVLLILGSIIGGLYLSMKYQIVCQQKGLNQAQACLLKNHIFNIYKKETALGDLSEARVVGHRGRKGSMIYTIEIYNSSNSSTNLTGSSSSGREEKDAVANAINTYIAQSSNPSFDIPYPAQWWQYALTLAIAALGVGLFGIQGSTSIFDRSAQKVMIHRKGLFNQSQTEIPFAEIDKIIVETSRDRRNASIYRLAILLNSKQSLPLVKSYDSALSKKEKIANELNSFIKNDQR